MYNWQYACQHARQAEHEIVLPILSIPHIVVLYLNESYIVKLCWPTARGSSLSTSHNIG